ncbi:MAG: hypothetical protein K2P02_09230 [Lachnospiraceae bacterium]|nr:hypothetical protein [Lachnospiraceae bacterium]
MNGKIKEAFNQVQAEEALKSRTKAFLAQKTRGYTKPAKRPSRIYAVACVCSLFFLIGGRWLYFTPTSEISIEINPSFELSINRFDRVFSVNSLNADGQEITNALDLKFKNYADAIDQILENQDIVTLLSNGEIMTITVMGPNETQSAKIFSQIEACTAGHRNTYCHFSSSEEAAGANITGLSHGKYRAFLEIQSLDPGITPEEIQGMTMREIRDLMNELSAGNESETSSARDKEHGHHRHGREKETQTCIQ